VDYNHGMPIKKKPQRFIASKQAGYDSKSRRWRSVDGQIVKKSEMTGKVRGAKIVEDGTGLSVSIHSRTPLTDVIHNYNKLQSMAVGLNDVFASTLVDQEPKPMPIPSNIRSMMALAEFYTSTIGDVFQHIEAPIDVAMTDLVIDCPDVAVKKELEELYSPQNYDMWNVLYESWLSCAIYGSAYPMEVPQANKIVMLPPRYVWVGYYVNYGAVPQATAENPSPYAMNPPDGYSVWTEELVNTTVMPMSYNTFGAYANEQILKGWGLPLDPNLLHPIRAKAMSWQRYPLPPIARAFNSISSRLILQEAIRATIEGIKNQLWVFHLGDKDYRPQPKEVKAFTSMLMSAAGDRTGTIVWTDPFKVEQHTPANTDSLLANDTYQTFTSNVFRDLGGNLRLETGNGLITGRADGASIQFDLSLWLKRIEWPRRNVLRWEKEFRSRLAERQNSAAWKKANENTTVHFSKSLLEVGDLIKQELVPLYSLGSMSTQTLLERSGYNYQAELERKKAEEVDEALFQPRSTFSQTTVNPDTPEKKTDSTSSGRPTGNGDEPPDEGEDLEASVPTWDETKKGITLRKSMRS
jgi:hypothetical protein